MRALCLLLSLLLVVEVTAGSGRQLTILKCCRPFEMLSGDGGSCVEAPWPRNVSPGRGRGDLEAPFDARWLSRWLPPGLPLHRVGKVEQNQRVVMFNRPLIRVVNSSAEWDERQAEAEGAAYWRSDRVVFRNEGVIRLLQYLVEEYPVVLGLTPNEQSMEFCVDAALPPLAPFALLTDPNCEFDDCIIKCCKPGRVLTVNGSIWRCEDDLRGYWTPENSSFARFLHPHTPYSESSDDWDFESNCFSPGALRMAPGDPKMAPRLRRLFNHFLFSSWHNCPDFERLENGTLAETLFFCQESRITRGVYWLLRPLCYVSTSLLVVALISVATNSCMRHRVHGWCLACHTICLLGFNLGQVVYYKSFSEEVDSLKYVPAKLLGECETLAFPMYFLLNAANCWLTALCLNMAFGFRKLQVVRHDGGGNRKRFLVLSAVAWGLPALMAGLCAQAFDRNLTTRKWYSPTLVETRTCFIELIGYGGSENESTVSDIHRNPGTALFYYGPVGVLVVANAICIAYTFRKVQFLRQGNSVLYKEGNMVFRTHRQAEGEKPQTVSLISKEANSTVTDAHSIRVYTKLLLMTGVVEMAAECIGWATSNVGKEDRQDIDYTFAYRATGYAADCFRAACVAWLAAPEGGYFGTLRRRLDGRERGRRSRK